MDILQKAFEKQLIQLITPEYILLDLFKKKLVDIGIKLTSSQLDKLKEEFSHLGNGIIHFEFDDGQVLNAGFADNKQLEQAIQSILNCILADIDSLDNYIYSKLEKACLGILEEVATIHYNRIKLYQKNHIRYFSKLLSDFNRGIMRTWGRPLRLLSMFIIVCQETGEYIDNEYREIAAGRNDLIFETLTRLHARSCQICSEILVLLKSGHADGAHARWRSLHEISVVASFIKKNGNETANRYLLHHAIESLKAAKLYQEHCIELGYKPIPLDEIDIMEDDVKELILQFGDSYENEYGWASDAIKKIKPTFRDIEKAVGLDHLRPYYKMACYNVHANPTGLFIRLGLYDNEENILLAGPSNIGLEDPGRLTALSLAQITAYLLTINSNLDTLAACKTIKRLMDEIDQEFLKAKLLLEKTENIESE